MLTALGKIHGNQCGLLRPVVVVFHILVPRNSLSSRHNIRSDGIWIEVMERLMGLLASVSRKATSWFETHDGKQIVQLYPSGLVTGHCWLQTNKCNKANDLVLCVHCSSIQHSLSCPVELETQWWLSIPFIASILFSFSFSPSELAVKLKLTSSNFSVTI